MVRRFSGRYETRLCSILVIAFAVLFLSSAVTGQTLQIKNPGTGSEPLEGTWKFHLGDDPAWADPSLPDADWQPIRMDARWGAQGYPGYTGFAWYRRRIEIDDTTNGTKNPALLLWPAQDAYDIYWNGQKLGSYGKLPPHASWWMFGHPAVYPLPSSTGVLAFRVWRSPLSSVDPDDVGGFAKTPLLGDASLLQAAAQSNAYKNDEHQLPDLFISVVALVIGAMSFLLYLRDRKQGLYLWLAVYLAAAGVFGIRELAVFRMAMTFISYQFVTQLGTSMQDISLWLILLCLFGMIREQRWRRVTGWIIATYLTAQVIDIATIFLWAHGGMLPWIDGITTAVYSATPLFVFVLIGVGLSRRNRPTFYPLILSVGLSALFNVVSNLAVQGNRFTHWTTSAALLSVGLRVGEYFFNLSFIFTTLIFLSLIFTIAHEQFLERELQARIELEIKSAREVQRILLPEELPAIAGLSISSVYRPAEEVGGDFFQVIATEDGGALIALGDVSGKGLKAAMTVSLIVGTLRTLADYTQSPADILRGLNRRLLGRIDAGFATCVITRIDPGGASTIANAGHLAPFQGDSELPVNGSLPLGLTLDAAYDELPFLLHERETLTFYTDGILEARNSRGELYGFDRLSALIGSRPTIEQMVEAACAFGQEDDITVFQVTRLPDSAPAEAARMSMATQIAGT